LKDLSKGNKERKKSVISPGKIRNGKNRNENENLVLALLITIALPKVKLYFAQKSFYFLGASAFKSLPLKIKQISSRVLFRESVDQFFV